MRMGGHDFHIVRSFCALDANNARVESCFLVECGFTPLITIFGWVVRVRDLRSNASGLDFTLFLNYVSGLS
jgi:hypothetical protein